MVASQIYSWFGHQCCQPGNKIHRLESHLGYSISVGCFQGVDYFAGGTDRKTGNSHPVGDGTAHALGVGREQVA